MYILLYLHTLHQKFKIPKTFVISTYLLNPVFTHLILLICDSYMIVNIMWASQTRFPSQSHFRVSIPKSAGDVEVSSLAQYHGELQTCYYWKLCTIKDNK